MAKLVCRAGPDAGHEYPLEDKRTSFGRQGSCNHQIKDPKASREHFVIERTGDLYSIFDRKSRNGTRVNDRRISEHLLTDHDVVTVGRCEYVFVLGPEDKRLSDLITKYELGERVGSGGMGIVFSAKQRSMDRDVALKILAPKFCNKQRFIDQFIREARSAGALNHPNIIQVHDVGTENGVHYFSMEMVLGDTCLALLKQNGPFPADQAGEIIRQTAKALEYAHNQRIIHRDIKPENIMLTRTGAVKLADLGISKTFDELESEKDQRVVGTPHYIAPEAASGKKFDHRVDIYSLGATFFHLVTGETPFKGSKPNEILRAHVNDPVPDPKAIVPSLPAEVAAMIQRMMAKKPEERYGSAEELAQEIERLQSTGVLQMGAENGNETMLLRNLASGNSARNISPTTRGTINASKNMETGTGATRPQPPARSRKSSNRVLAFVLILVLLGAALVAAAKFAGNPAGLLSDPPTDTASAIGDDSDVPAGDEADEEEGGSEAETGTVTSDDRNRETEQYAQITKLLKDLERATTPADIERVKRNAAALREQAASKAIKAELVSLDTQIEIRLQEILRATAKEDFARLKPEIQELLDAHHYDQAEKRLQAYQTQHGSHAAHEAELLARDIEQRRASFLSTFERRLRILETRKDLSGLRELRKSLPPSLLESDLAKQVNQAIAGLVTETLEAERAVLHEMQNAVEEWRFQAFDQLYREEAEDFGTATRQEADELKALNESLRQLVQDLDDAVRPRWLYRGTIDTQDNPYLGGAEERGLILKLTTGGEVTVTWKRLDRETLEEILTEALEEDAEQHLETLQALGQLQQNGDE